MASTYINTYISHLTESPNERVKILIDQARKYGTSKDSRIERIVYAPLYALSALALSAVDVPSCPILGFYKASVQILDLSQWSTMKPLQTFGTGIVDGVRSLYQVVLLISTFVVGFIIPHIMYGALPILNTTQGSSKTLPEQAETSHGQALNTLQEQLRTAQTAATEATERARVLEEQVRQAQTDHGQALNTLQEQLRTAQTATTQATERVRVLEEQVRQAQTDHGQALNTLQEKLTAAQTAATEAARRVTALEEQAQQAQTDHGQALNTLRKQLSAAQTAADTATERATALEDQARQARTGYEEKIKRLEGELANALTPVDGDNEEVKKLKESIQSMQDTHRIELEKIQGELRVAQTTKTQATERVRTLEAQAEQAQNGYQEALKKLEEKLTATQTTAAQEAGKVTILEEQLKTIKETYEKEVSGLQEKLKAAQEQSKTPVTSGSPAKSSTRTNLTSPLRRTSERVDHKKVYDEMKILLNEGSQTKFETLEIKKVSEWKEGWKQLDQIDQAIKGNAIQGLNLLSTTTGGKVLLRLKELDQKNHGTLQSSKTSGSQNGTSTVVSPLKASSNSQTNPSPASLGQDEINNVCADLFNLLELSQTKPMAKSAMLTPAGQKAFEWKEAWKQLSLIHQAIQENDIGVLTLPEETMAGRVASKLKELNQKKQ